MKKILTLTAAAAMALSLVACHGAATGNNSSEAVVANDDMANDMMSNDVMENDADTNAVAGNTM